MLTLRFRRMRSLTVLFAACAAWGFATAHPPGAWAQNPPGQAGPPGQGAAPRMVDVLIGFDQPPGAPQRDLVRGRGGEIRRIFWLVPAVAARIPETAVQALANARGVTVVEPDGEFHAVDDPQPPLTEQQVAAELSYGWGVGHIGAGPLHAMGKLGASVRVAVLDTGITPHIELGIAGGGNFTDVGPAHDYLDRHGHGTHVAGTIAAFRNGFGVVGVAPAVELYGLKVLRDNGSGQFSFMISALEWCVLNGIDVTNHSYSSGSNPGSLMQQAFDAAYHDFGIVHVAAAGNAGNAGGNNDSVQWPARYASVVAVAATNQNDSRASFSSSGPAVEVSAPGVSIFSTYIDGLWVQMSGTSMASPHVAGVAALLVAEGVVDPDAVRFLIGATAKPLGSANRFGAGLVQAFDAVALVSDVTDPPPGDDEPTDPEPEDPPPPGDDDPVEPEPENPPPGRGNGRGNGNK